MAVWPALASAEINSLFSGSALAGSRGGLLGQGASALVPVSLPAAEIEAPEPASQPPAAIGQSLFSGQSGNSFFRPYPVRDRSPQPARGGVPLRLSTGGVAAAIRDLIASVEAGPLGYDAVQYGARIRPGRPPTSMTIAEIYAWIDATPGQPHAIGRYQFIPPTLRRLVRSLGIDPQTRFTPQVQDQLADMLLAEAGYYAFRSGAMSRADFMHNLSKIWAGLPSKSGRSYYHGYAGNRATMSWARFDAAMRRIAPG